MCPPHKVLDTDSVVGGVINTHTGTTCVHLIRSLIEQFNCKQSVLLYQGVYVCTQGHTTHITMADLKLEVQRQSLAFNFNLNICVYVNLCTQVSMYLCYPRFKAVLNRLLAKAIVQVQ